MTYGLDDRTLHRLRCILAAFPEIDRAVLYGSRAMGTERSGSDIDLTLHGPGLTWALCREVGGMFEASAIPYRVDVSVFELLQHEALREHIVRRGVVLFDREEWDRQQAEFRAVRRGQVKP